MNLSVVAYDSRYNESLYELESSIVQGNNIRLGIIKKHFLDRSVVFKKYHALLAIDSNNIPVATCIGAKTNIIVNGNYFDAGVGYEVKVSPRYRNKGVGKLMTKAIYKEFFRKEGLSKNFTTIKKANIPIVRLLSKALPNMWLYEFTYLTIPTSSRLPGEIIDKPGSQLLSVSLFNENEIDPSFFVRKKSGLGYFNTYKLYQLKILHISRLYKTGLRLLRKLNPAKYQHLPAPGESMKFATLFNHTPGNIFSINEVLDELEKDGIGYLLVCCRNNDTIFKTIKNISVNSYPYYLLTDFPVKEKDEVSIDVRCL